MRVKWQYEVIKIVVVAVLTWAIMSLVLDGS